MRVGECPSCRAPVDFSPGAGKVKVCEHCQTVVLRGEARLEDLGRVADLVDTGTPLHLGLAGRYSGAPFTVKGRIQKANPTGTWDEWYLAFEDEREGWLAESEGEWKLMFPVTGVALPSADDLAPLGSFVIRERTFVVEEKNAAETLAAEGQLPDFNRRHTYVDATGPRGVFCTLDTAGGETSAYVGQFVTLDALGFDRSELAPSPRKALLSAARCTECNGMLELKAPDATKRVACPYCGALLDVQHGKLSFLQLLEKPPHEPLIPLGAKGRLHDPTDQAPKGEPPTWTCLAFLIRSCTVEGTRYPWDEYLLWNERLGFRWLMQSNGHWTWLTPIPAGDVELSFRHAQHAGRGYRGYQSIFARTDYVVGECYWTVQVGDLAQAQEFVEPPWSINLDLTDTEATFTLGVMLEREVVQRAFQLKGTLPEPEGQASAQVNPHAAKAAEGWTWAGIWAVVLLGLVLVFALLGTRGTYYAGTFSVPPGAAPGSPEAQRFSEPFQVPVKVPLKVEVAAPGLSNNWLGVSVDLVNEQTSEVVSVYAEPSYYAGVSDGESWSEGSREESKTVDTVDPGTWVLRATPSFEPSRQVDYAVTVKASDGPGFCFPFTLFLILLVVPIFRSLRSSAFETQRWNDAVFQSSPGVSTFPYAKEDDE